MSVERVIETPQEGARRLSDQWIRKGYIPEALHCYKSLEDKEIYYRFRLKNAEGDKEMRPMHRNESGFFIIGEPPGIKDKPKPLYGLQYVALYKEGKVYIVEGEWNADHLNKFFEINDVLGKYFAITSGGCTSAQGADWTPLSERKCILWADNDQSGTDYIDAVIQALSPLGCTIKCIDIEVLQLSEGGDVVDWLQL